MCLATNPDVLFHNLQDILSINDLYYTHGISLHVINTVLVPVLNKPNRDYMIYVVNFAEDMNEILMNETFNKNSDISEFEIEDVCGLDDLQTKYMVVQFKAIERNITLSREDFNIGISFIFIIKYLIQPMTRL